jgi:RimJ/RimL family protein N-acetyltransferase
MMSGLMIELEPYSDADFPLLERHNSPEMTQRLGGPETGEKLAQRHQRYLELQKTGKARMFRIVLLPEAEAVGIIGYWEKTWQDALVWEAGWGVLPEYQGRGIAKAALAALVARARLEKTHRFLHAFPSVDNPPSNAICRRVGFELIEAHDFEYPPGHMMRCNDWRLDLHMETGR